MQKQSMNRAAAFITSVASVLGINPTSNKNNPYKDVKRLGRKHPGNSPARSFWQCAANDDGYGRSIVGTPRYRAYKLKRNRRARAACGGTLPKKFA